MNNKIIIGVVAVLIIILLGAGGYFVLKSQAPKSEMAPSSPSTQSQNPNPPAQPKSLFDLLSMGAQKCTFANNLSADSQVSGTVYAANGKVRGDISSTNAGKVTGSHVLLENPTMYVWMDGQANGFKLNVQSQGGGAATNSAGASSFNAQEKMNYQCLPWTADESLFTLPTNVQFSDMTGLQTPSAAPTGPAGNTPSLQCAACNSLSGAQKAQCLAVLKCP